MALTERFTRAVDYVRIQHAAQVRKGSRIPYIAHLLGVASLVLEHGGDEDQAIAGLLHDVIEDCGAEHAAVVRNEFGDAVADIVVACTDGTAQGKSAHADAEAKRRDWWVRKRDYLHKLESEPAPILLVSACDKLHNALAIVGDLEDPAVGTAVFDRFKAGRDGTLRYYHALAELMSARHAAPARTLEAAVSRMHALAGVSKRSGLDDGI